MGLETFEGLPGVVLFFVIVACIAGIFGFRLRRPKAPPAEPAHEAPPPGFERAIEREMTGAPPPARVDHAGFRALADRKLEPLLNALVDRAHAHGYEARYEVLVDAESAKYRLEVKRPDLPDGQPLPYISFSAGEDDQVDVVYGGVFPAPSDRNKQDPEIGWRTVRWDQVDDVLLTFTHKVFARFD